MNEYDMIAYITFYVIGLAIGLAFFRSGSRRKKWDKKWEERKKAREAGKPLTEKRIIAQIISIIKDKSEAIQNVDGFYTAKRLFIRDTKVQDSIIKELRGIKDASFLWEKQKEIKNIGQNLKKLLEFETELKESLEILYRIEVDFYKNLRDWIYFLRRRGMNVESYMTFFDELMKKSPFGPDDRIQTRDSYDFESAAEYSGILRLIIILHNIKKHDEVLIKAEAELFEEGVQGLIKKFLIDKFEDIKYAERSWDKDEVREEIIMRALRFKIREQIREMESLQLAIEPRRRPTPPKAGGVSIARAGSDEDRAIDDIDDVLDKP